MAGGDHKRGSIGCLQVGLGFQRMSWIWAAERQLGERVREGQRRQLGGGPGWLWSNVMFGWVDRHQMPVGLPSCCTPGTSAVKHTWLLLALVQLN